MAADPHAHIEELVAEEHRLWQLESAGRANQDDRARLDQIKLELDRYWDLLRRRRGAANAGADPDSVELVDSDTVEGYLQ
jgi:hypothetical protein